MCSNVVISEAAASLPSTAQRKSFERCRGARRRLRCLALSQTSMNRNRQAPKFSHWPRQTVFYSFHFITKSYHIFLNKIAYYHSPTEMLLSAWKPKMTNLRGWHDLLHRRRWRRWVGRLLRHKCRQIRYNLRRSVLSQHLILVLQVLNLNQR